jgi:hypothetical protein
MTEIGCGILVGHVGKVGVTLMRVNGDLDSSFDEQYD